jgi:hypothetical protein
MNLVLSETDGTHIAVLMGVGQFGYVSDLENILDAISNHFDNAVSGISITEEEYKSWIENPWGLNKDYSLSLDKDEDTDNRTIVNIQQANLFY